LIPTPPEDVRGGLQKNLNLNLNVNLSEKGPCEHWNYANVTISVKVNGNIAERGRGMTFDRAPEEC
jgi:hypothetical protein